MSMNDADLRFRATLSDDVTPQVDKIVRALKQAGASPAEIRMTLKAIDEATPKIKEARRQLEQMPQQTTINVNANVTRAHETVKKMRMEAEKPLDMSFDESATSRAVSSFQRVMDKLRGTANTLTLPLANALPGGLGQNLYYGLGAGVLGGLGYGAQSLARSTVGINSEREQQMVTLQQTLKDNTRAQQEATKLIGIAQKTPFNYSDLLQADTRLRSYQIPALPSDVAAAHGKDATKGKGWLDIAGNMAAALNTPATQAVEAIADARQGYFRRLEDYGIRLQAQDFAGGGKYSGLTYEQGLARAARPFEGAKELQSRTLGGLTSNLHDVAQNQILQPLGAVPFQLLKQEASSLYQKSGTDSFQRGLGTDVEKIQRGMIGVFDQLKKGKEYFDINIKQPLMDATTAVVRFGSTVAKNFGGTVLTAAKTFGEAVGLIASGLKQLAGNSLFDSLVKLVTIFKALQFLGFRSADPVLGLARALNPLSFSLKGVMTNLLALPGAIAKIGTVILIKNFLDAKQAAQALNNQFKDLTDNQFDKLNADITLMSSGLNQTADDMQRLVTIAAAGIPHGVKDRAGVAVEVAKDAAAINRDTGLNAKQVAQGVIDEMKRTGQYSKDAADTFATDVKNAGLAAKEFGLSLTDVQRTMLEFRSSATPVGLGGYKGAPFLQALQLGANSLPLTHQQIAGGTLSGDQLLMRMLQQYKAPSVDLLKGMGGASGFDSIYNFHNSQISKDFLSKFSDRNDTYNANDIGSARALSIVRRQAPDATIPQVANPWNEQHMGVNVRKLTSISNPIERANQVFKEWQGNTDQLDRVNGKVQVLTNELNKLNAASLGYSQGVQNINLQMEEWQHTLVPMQRAIEDQSLAIQKYQFDAIHPLERQMTRMNMAASQVSQTLQNAQYDMGKYSEGLLTGEQAVLDQSHALDNYNKQLQLLQLLNQQLGAQLGSTTYERGYSATVKPMMGLTLAMQMQKSERDQQKHSLEYDLKFGEQHYQLQQAARTQRQRSEMSFSERLSGIQKDVPIIDDATAAQHRMGIAQFELQKQMFGLNENLQDQQDALQGLQLQLQAASTSPHFRHLQDEQYNLQIATEKASIALTAQQTTIDRWNALIPDLKSQGQDLGDVFKNMLGFDSKNPLEQARHIVQMAEKLPESLGGISKDQGDAFIKQLDRMEGAVKSAQKRQLDTSRNWFDTVKNTFLGLFNQDTWNVIGAQVKNGLDGIVGSSLAGVIGGGIAIGGEATTIAVSSGIIGNLIRLTVGRAVNKFLTQSGMFKGFYEGLSHVAQRGMVFTQEAGIPGGQFFARRAVAAQQMADGTRIGGTVGEAITGPFRVIQRFRQLLFGGIGGAVGGVVGGPFGALAGGMAGRSIGTETTLRDTGKAMVDAYKTSAKAATTIQEKMVVAADATKRVAKNVGDVVEPVVKAAAYGALKIPGVQPVTEFLAQTRGIRGVSAAAKAQLLPLSVLKDIERGKISVEDALRLHGGVPAAAATAASDVGGGGGPRGGGRVGGLGLTDTLDMLKGKFTGLGHSVEDLDGQVRTAASGTQTLNKAAAPAVEAAKSGSPALAAAKTAGASSLTDMLKFRKIAGPLGVLFDSVLASGVVGHGDIQHQGEGGLIGTGIGALLGGVTKGKGGALLGAGLGGLIGSAAGSDNPFQAALITAGAIAAQKYILELGVKLIAGLRTLFRGKVTQTAVAEGALAGEKAGAAMAEGELAAGGGIAGKGGIRGRVGGLFGRLKGAGGLGAGLAIGVGGNLLGHAVGGQGGATISGAATGASLGMFVGPEGAIAGGLIGGLIGMLSSPSMSNAQKALEHFKGTYEDFTSKAVRTGDWVGLRQEADRAREIAKVNPGAADALNKTADALDKESMASHRAEQGRRVQEFISAYGDALKHGAKVTPQFIKSMNHSLSHLTPDAQRHAMHMMHAMAKKLYDDGKIPLAAYKALVADFHKEGKKLKKHAKDQVQGMLDAMTMTITDAIPGLSKLGQTLWDMLKPNKMKPTDFLKNVLHLTQLPHGAGASAKENEHYLNFTRNLERDVTRGLRPPTHTGPLKSQHSGPGEPDPGTPGSLGSGGSYSPNDYMPGHGRSAQQAQQNKQAQKLVQDHEEAVRRTVKKYRDENTNDDDKNNKDRQQATKDHHKKLFDFTDNFSNDIRTLRLDALGKQNKIEDNGFQKIHGTTKDWLGKISKAVKGMDTSLGLTGKHHGAASNAANATSDIASNAANNFAGGGLSKADLHKIGPGRLARLNEEGHDEMIIPLAPHRRNRAKSLVEQAKSMMGFANGGVSMKQAGPFVDASGVSIPELNRLISYRAPLPTGHVTVHRGDKGDNPSWTSETVAGRPAAASATNHGEIWVKSLKALNSGGYDARSVINHELGHIFDFRMLNNSAHDRFEKILGKTGKPWWGKGQGYDSPGEWFAESYRLDAMGQNPSDYYAGYDFHASKKQWKNIKRFINKVGRFANGGYTYANPMAHAHGIVPERVDMGVDYAFAPGSRLDAIGKARINIAQSSGSGWPGGGYVNYTFLEGPAKGRSVFWAEDLRPTVHAGQVVRAGQQIAKFVGGSSGTEIGWASGPINQTLAAALGQQNHNGDPGEFPTAAGASFSHFLESLGAPGGIINGKPRGQMPKSWKAFTDLSVGKGVGALPKVPKKLQQMGLVGPRLYRLLQAKKKYWQNHIDGNSGAMGDIGNVGNISSQRSWAIKLLNILGDPNTHQNRAAIVGWETAEGGHWNNSAKFNPLNTTLNEPGARSINSVGVKAYGSWEQGFKATVDTLRNYHGILSALHSGNNAMAVASAIGASPWGTSGGLVTGAIRAMLGHKSLAGGLREVPYDNMPALLHKGERVMTAGENNHHKSRQVGSEGRVTAAYEVLQELRRDVKHMRTHLQNIDDKTEKKKATHDLQDLNSKVRQQWANVRHETRLADRSLSGKIAKYGDASDGEGTSAVIARETQKMHTTVNKAVRKAKNSKAYHHAVQGAKHAAAAVHHAVKQAHSKHSPGGRKVTKEEKHHISQLRSAAHRAARLPDHILSQARKGARADYIVGAAHRGVNSALVRQITGKGLDKAQTQLYNKLIKELQKGTKAGAKQAQVIAGRLRQSITQVQKNHKETKKTADTAKKQRDQATKETHKITSLSDKTDKKRDKADRDSDKRDKEFHKSALAKLDALVSKDLNVTVNNTATGATLKTSIKGGRKKSK